MSFELRTARGPGVGGQDGALLAAHLLERGVAVVGTHRPRRAFDDWRLRELGIADHPRLRVVELDLCALLHPARFPGHDDTVLDMVGSAGE